MSEVMNVGVMNVGQSFDKQKITVSNSSFTSKFHFFSAFSTGPGKVTILVLAHNSIEVK